MCDTPGKSGRCFTYCVYNLNTVKFKPFVVKRNFDRVAFDQSIKLEPWETIFCVCGQCR